MPLASDVVSINSPVIRTPYARALLALLVVVASWPMPEAAYAQSNPDIAVFPAAGQYNHRARIRIEYDRVSDVTSGQVSFALGGRAERLFGALGMADLTLATSFQAPGRPVREAPVAVELTFQFYDMERSATGAETLDLTFGETRRSYPAGRVHSEPVGERLHKESFTAAVPLADFLVLVAADDVVGRIRGKGFRLEAGQIAALRDLASRMAPEGRIVRFSELGGAPSPASVQPTTAAGPPALGRYGVTHVDGRPFPARLAPRGQCDRILSGGSLDLKPYGRFTLALSIHEACRGHGSGLGLTSEGTYAAQDGRLVFRTTGGDTFAVASEAGDLVAQLLGAALTFRLGEAGTADALEFLFEEQRNRMEHEAELSAEAVGAYRCMEDPLLDRAPALPAADTAGLGARIERHFPGWRLSTEREIGCRFPLIDGTRPEMYWGEAWGSGRAWWVWSGDFDGDGRQDTLVLLSSTSDPLEDRLGVLFASGEGAEVTSPGGWGVSLGPRKGETVGDPYGGPAVRLRGDAIAVVYWDKAGELLHWYDGRFQGISVGD